MENIQDADKYKAFDEYHAVQLYGMQFPRNLMPVLHEKLTGEKFDAGEFFKIVFDESEERVYLASTQALGKEHDVFLIDHAWTFRYKAIYNMLLGNEKLRNRMKDLVRYSEKRPLPESSSKYTDEEEKKRPSLEEYVKVMKDKKVVDLDGYDITSMEGLEFGEETEEISMYDNKIEEEKALLEKFIPLKYLKGIWCNGNPAAIYCMNFNNLFETLIDSLEIINSQFSIHASEWAILFCVRDQGITSLEDIELLDLTGRNVLNLKSLDIFKRMPRLHTLNIREHPDILQPTQQENNFIKLLAAIPQIKHILVDEEVETGLWRLHDKGILLEYLPNLKSINNLYITYGKPENHETEYDIRYILKHMWKYVNSYRLSTAEKMDEESVWYMMDEVGSAIIHSDDPNFAVHPFLYSASGDYSKDCVTYSIMWATKDVQVNEVITRDFLAGTTEKDFRSARLSIWFDVPASYFEKQLKIFNDSLKKIENQKEIVYKKFEENQSGAKVKGISQEQPIKVFTDLPYIKENLKSTHFIIVENSQEADILWVTDDLYSPAYKFYELKESQYVSQFPFESCIVMKNNLAQTIQNTFGNTNYFQRTYTLQEHLPSMIGDYDQRNDRTENNIWILKPINMARSMDSIITDSKDCIIRAMETGPKICQKYIENTLKYEDKYKFDLRFIVLVKSIIPLEIYLYNDFWIRLSNEEFTLDPRSFTSYETHFTVMNYVDKPMKTVQFPEFIDSFNKQHEKTEITWPIMLDRIKESIREIFIAAQDKYPHMQSDKARAIYGLDLMIDTEYNPKILELTFSPDCTRACKFNEKFFDDIFECLYLDDKLNNMSKI